MQFVSSHTGDGAGFMQGVCRVPREAALLPARIEAPRAADWHDRCWSTLHLEDESGGRTMTPWKLPLLAAGFIAVGACATNPVTGKRELALISEQQEVQIGKQAAQETEQQMGLVKGAALQKYV